MKCEFHDSGKFEFPGLILMKISTLLARYFETLVSRIGRNRIFS